MIKQIDDELYKTVCDWWKAKNYPQIPFEMLTEGFVSFSGNKPVFFGVLYSGGPFGFFAYPTVNPKSDFKEREEAFKDLINEVNKISKKLGVKCLNVITNNGSLIKRFEDNNFNQYDTDIVHLVKTIH